MGATASQARFPFGGRNVLELDRGVVTHVVNAPNAMESFTL